jgi:ATP phosphoribosyltransferase
MDAVICFQDVLDNYPVSYAKVPLPKETESKSKSISRICVIANQDFNLEEWQNDANRKLTIFSEYAYLTSQWIEKYKLTAKIVTVNGSTEGFLINRLCDLIVCVVATGVTVKENNLKIVEEIYRSELGLFVKKGLESKIQYMLSP